MPADERPEVLLSSPYLRALQTGEHFRAAGGTLVELLDQRAVALPPVDGAVLPGDTVTGTVEVSNDADTPLTDVSGTVEVEDLGAATVAPATVAPGQSVQLPVTLAIITVLMVDVGDEV